MTKFYIIATRWVRHEGTKIYGVSIGNKRINKYNISSKFKDNGLNFSLKFSLDKTKDGIYCCASPSKEGYWCKTNYLGFDDIECVKQYLNQYWHDLPGYKEAMEKLNYEK